MRDVRSISPLDKEETNSPEIADIFRNASFCSMMECPFDLHQNDVISPYLLFILHRYREEYRFDGIRWIARTCSRFISGDCSAGAQQEDEPSAVSVMLDVWRDIRATGMTIVRLPPRSHL